VPKAEVAVIRSVRGSRDLPCLAVRDRWWRGNLIAKPRGKVLPKVDKSIGRIFLQGFQSVPTEALRILSEYASVTKDFLDCVIDASWLPADKEKMKDVLKLELTTCNQR
jgi:hypothetical protein